MCVEAGFCQIRSQIRLSQTGYVLIDSIPIEEMLFLFLWVIQTHSILCVEVTTLNHHW